MDPVKGAGPITQVFGANPQFAWQLGYGHLGMDWGVPIGTPVYAIADGTVMFADWGVKMGQSMAYENAFIFGSNNSGICVVLQNDGWREVKAHLNSTSLNPGNKVKRGDIVGYSGTTGNSTGPHLHDECWVVGNPTSPPYGRYNLAAQIAHEDKVAGSSTPVLGITERRVGTSGTSIRAAANTSGKVLRSVAGNTVEKFHSYVIGQEVNQGNIKSNIWYKDDLGYSWAGAYTEQKITGLTNVTPLPPAVTKPANRRTVGPNGAIQRDAPNTAGRVVRTIGGKTTEDFTHFTRGQRVSQSAIGGGTIDTDIWYKDSIGWVWAGGFDEAPTTNGLTEFAAPKNEPAPVIAPPVEKYSFVKDLASITEVIPADWSNFGRGGMPALKDQTTVVLHQFNGAQPSENPTTNKDTVHLDSLINTFPRQTERVASAHVGVEKNRAIQFVSLSDRAYHAGPAGNGFWSIEIYGGMDDETKQKTLQVLRDMEKLAGRSLKLIDHRSLMATPCGINVDIKWFEKELHGTPIPEPKPTPIPTTPKPGAPKHSAETEQDVLTAFAEWLISLFINRKK